MCKSALADSSIDFLPSTFNYFMKRREEDSLLNRGCINAKYSQKAALCGLVARTK